MRSVSPVSVRRVGVGALALVLLCGTAAAQVAPAARGARAAAGVNLLADNVSPSAQMLRVARVVPAPGATLDAAAAAIRATGGRLVGVLDDGTLEADLTAADRRALARAGSVASAEPLPVALRLAPDIGLRDWQTAERQDLAGLGVSEFFVYAPAEEPAAGVLAAIAAVPGAAVIGSGLEGDVLLVRLTAPTAAAGELAQAPGVRWVEEAPELTYRNNRGRGLIQSGTPGVTPLYDQGLNGAGELIAVVDGPVRASHCSFSDPEADPFGASHRKIQAYTAPSQSDTHGTHVAGIALGDGGSNNDLRGVAWGARLLYDNIPTSFSESQLRNVLTQHRDQGGFIHTNSWGDDSTTGYTGLCRAIDAFMWDNDDQLVLFAATNTSTLKTPENAKNVLAVAAYSYSTSSGAFSICSGGVGPTADGRRKPEILALGCSVLSSYAFGTCTSVSQSGTSMATPAVAGAAAIARQYFTDGYHPTGFPTAADAFTPTGALLKAVLLNSTVNLEAGGSSTGYPSNFEGWGRLRLNDALVTPADSRGLIVRQARRSAGEGLTTGEAYQMQFSAAAGQALRITMVFNDAPGSIGSSAPVVNNLDLRVTSPTGAVYLGNVFNTSQAQSITGGTADARNTVEMVVLNTPAAGVYTVRVEGTAVLSGEVGYALAVSGAVSEFCPADLTGDGALDSADVLAALSQVQAGADLDADGVGGTIFDVFAYLAGFDAGCP